MGKTKNPPWSELPSEILQMIGESTQFRHYHAQYRAVCKSWRLSLLPKNRAQLLSPNLPFKIPSNIVWPRGSSWFVVSTTIFVIQPTKGPFKDTPSLLIVDELNPGFLSVRYPLSNTLRPSWDLGNPNLRYLNLLETRVRVISEVFSCRVLRVRQNASMKKRGSFEALLGWTHVSEKAVVVTNPVCGDDLLVMVLYDGGRAGVLRVRKGKWDMVFDGTSSKCYDVVKFKGEIYGIDQKGQVFNVVYDFDEGLVNLVMVSTNMSEGGESGGKRLVVVKSKSCCEELYMVVRKIRSSISTFLVYKLNEDGKVWEKVSSLGNLMFFVGVDVSFCASLEDFPGLDRNCRRSHPGNCIFFSKGSFPVGGVGEDGDRYLFGVGKDGTGMNIGQYHLGDPCATGLLEPAYVIMFMPPIFV